MGRIWLGRRRLRGRRRGGRVDDDEEVVGFQCSLLGVE